MKKLRIIYFTLTCSTIFIGVFSRQISFIPAFIGDALWAIMMFFILRFFFTNTNLKILLLGSLCVCYFVEFSQLYQVEWLNSIRKTLPGRLVLGQGFLWSDIISYSFGIIIVSRVEVVIIKPIIDSIK